MGNEWSSTAKPPEEQQALTGNEQQQQQQQQQGSQQQQEQLPSALVMVGPSGVGKNALISRITAGSDSFGHSVSHTTRQPRAGERHGEHYFFTTKEQFAKEIAEDKFIEYAEVHGNLYGTSVAAVRRVLESGRSCILDIDVQGARLVRRTPLKAIFVFVAPPSLEDLAKRLYGRGTETPEQIQNRLANAKAEINSVNERGLYDYLIINDNLEDAEEKLRGIAARALQGLEPEPGKVPESVVIEDAPYLPSPDPSTAPRPDLGTQGVVVQNTPADGPGVPVPTLPAQPAPSPADANPAASLGVQPPAANATQGAVPSPPPPVSQPAAPAQGPAPPPQAPSHQQPQPPSGQQQPVASTPASTHQPASAPGSQLQLPGLKKWQDKVALVTGASSGIGWATCEVLAQQGMRVVAVARRKEKLEALQVHMHNLRIPPSHFLPVVCDITKDAEVATLPRIVAKRWPEAGGVDVLINNAGLSRNDASLMDGNVASWVEMLSTNVLGPAMAIKAAVQDMRRRNKWGHIINMVGLSGHRIPDGPQGGGFYCATKSAVKTLTEGLRQEARGQLLPLRVSAISPGVVETEFFTVKNYGDAEAGKQSTTAYKCLQPQDVAQAVLWCLSAPDHVEVNDIVVRPTEQLL